MVYAPLAHASRKPRGKDRGELGASLIDGPRDAEVAKLRHGEPLVAARVDVGKRREVHRDIECEPVVGAAVAHAQAQRRDFRFTAGGHHVNARRRGLAVRANAHCIEPSYHARLDLPDHRANAEASSLEVEQQIRDELSGAVVGDLAAAVDLDRGNPVVTQQVLAPARKSQRVDRGMLGEPDFVARIGAARGGERLHRAPGRLVLGAAERANRNTFAAWRHQTLNTCGAGERHSTIVTIGCDVRSR